MAAKEDPCFQDYQSFITDIAAVVFLGTPHNSSSIAKVASWGAQFLSAFRSKPTHPDILRSLVPQDDDWQLGILTDQFHEATTRSRLEGIKSYYYWRAS